MTEATILEAKVRDKTGWANVQRLRRQGQLPGVIYGHKEAARALTVSEDAMRSVIRHGQRVVDLHFDGKTEKCFIKEVQWDAIGKVVLHVDFTRISIDERIRVTVPVVVRGTAPGVNAGGVLQQPMHTMEIECLAISVPESIRVNVHELQLEQALHLKDLHLPEGVKAFGDPEAVVVHVVKPMEEAPAAPGEVVAGPAEPEVITRKPEEKEEAE